MSENITYNISERAKQQDIFNVDDLIAEVDANHSMSVKDANVTFETEDDFFALEMEYSMNYTIKTLSIIIDYYELQGKRMKKDELVQLLVIFECDPDNIEIVKQRRRMWRYIDMLKNDKFLNKYILVPS